MKNFAFVEQILVRSLSDRNSTHCSGIRRNFIFSNLLEVRTQLINSLTSANRLLDMCSALQLLKFAFLALFIRQNGIEPYLLGRILHALKSLMLVFFSPKERGVVGFGRCLTACKSSFRNCHHPISIGIWIHVFIPSE